MTDYQNGPRNDYSKNASDHNWPRTDYSWSQAAVRPQLITSDNNDGEDDVEDISDFRNTDIKN